MDAAAPRLFTIGHSVLAFEDFVAILRAFEIDAIADVRSQPSARRAPQYDRWALASALRAAGIRYAYMGDGLGGRPDYPRFYDEDGRVRYDAWSTSERFLAALARVERAAKRRRLALMCAEEDPAQCHRHLLIARVLVSRGWPRSSIIHLRGDGLCSPEDTIPVQPPLPGEDGCWRSRQSVLRKVLPSTSSGG